MPQIDDQAWLAREQYKDSTNLNARIAIHDRFSTNPYPWMRWVFDQLDLPPEARVLEVGCGSGKLWAENADRIPPGWRVTLTDLSPGMVAEARGACAGAGRAAGGAAADAQALPFAAAAFDAVIANHMLYHVPDRPRALAELRRVLRPGGRLVATTIGAGHMRELDTLLQRFDPMMPALWEPTAGGPSFELETGAAQLAPYFTAIEQRVQPNGLLVPDVEPIVAYIVSGRRAAWVGAHLDALRRFVAAELAAHGPLQVTKESGMFLARRAAG